MRRYWIRWIGLLVFVVVLGGVFVRLGEWQIHRLDQRRASNAIVVANEAAPIVDYTEVFGRPITDADQWRRVSVTGEFMTDRQLQVRYRSNSGDTGSEILTPLRTTSGDILLVSRGFLSRSQTGDAVPPAPTGTVTLTGNVRRNERGTTAQLTPNEDTIRLISAPVISQWLGQPTVDGYLGLLTITPEQDGNLVAVKPPELSEGPHFWYAVQWFMFTGIALTGLVVFIRGDVKSLRAARRPPVA